MRQPLKSYLHFIQPHPLLMKEIKVSPFFIPFSEEMKNRESFHFDISMAKTAVMLSPATCPCLIQVNAKMLTVDMMV